MVGNEWLIACLILLIANMFMSLWLVFTFGKMVNKWKSLALVWLFPVVGLVYCFFRYYRQEKKLPSNPDYNTEGVSGKSDHDVWWP